MFKKLKIFFLKYVWSRLPDFSTDFWIFLTTLFSTIISIFFDFIKFFSPVYFFLKNFFVDLKILIRKYWGLSLNIIFKHRFIYILRLIFLIFFLYKPTLIDLDSVYWIFSIVFYFVTNNIFFFLSYITPFTAWALHAPSLRFLLFFCIFPALYSSKRLKKVLKKKKKILLKDDEVFFIFHWAQRIFIFSVYFLFCYLSFFLLSILIPFLYIFFSGDVSFVFFKTFYFSYFSHSRWFYYISLLLPDYVFISYLVFFFKLVIIFAFNFINLYLFPLLLKILVFFALTLFNVMLNFFLFLLSFIKNYLFYFFLNLKSCFFIFLFFVKFLCSLKYASLLEIYKNFLFSDNFFIFLSFIFSSFIELFYNFFIFFFSSILSKIVSNPNWQEFLPVWVWYKDLVLNYFYLFIIKFLNFAIPILNTYLRDLSFFGLISTWYEYLNQGVQRGILRNSFLNWAFIHLYASIIAFWFLDFDFKVSVKTPPKTPHTLLKEAKRTQDWIPQNMDFLTLQTRETKIYFAMLDISFEHVESLHFIYGDFEYVDEEYDYEDETPDDEEYWNDSEETMKVREIIESDLGFTLRPNKFADGDPLDKNDLEKHHITEIVGEPELLFVEEPLKWVFSSIYSPTFEELHFKDSLFSEWVFDPDEDLTFFEFLLLFPFLFFFVYVWFFHRRKRKHYRSYLRFFVPVRRTVFSGWWVEDFLGLPIGEWLRYCFDKVRHYTAPDVKFKSVHKFRMYRNRQKFKLMQLESFHFERLRLKLYYDSLKYWEDLTAKSVKILKPKDLKPYMLPTFRTFKYDTRLWAWVGDWKKFFLKPEPKPEKVLFLFESLQVNLSRLIDKYVNRRGRKRFRKSLWRTIQHIPGHLSMPYYPKQWNSRFKNIFIYFPVNNTKYNYSYYNYIGWRNNRSKWRRYASMPGNVSDKVFEFDRSLRKKDYNLYKRWQKRRRLMRIFQF